jgi:tetratricopeptide (TPR) repeat protein
VIIAAYAGCSQIPKAIEAASSLPPDAKTQVQIGRLFLAIHQPAAAIRFLSHAGDDNPSWFIARLSLAEAYLTNHDAEGALKQLDQLAGSERNSADALELRATCLRMTGRVVEAEQVFRKLPALFPDDPRSYVNATQIPLEEQHWNEALQILNVGLARMPENWLLLFRRGMTLKFAGRISAAQEDLIRALRSGGDTLLISAALGDIYASQGDLKGAIELFRETFEKTGAPEFQLAYALALARQGDNAKAIPQFEAAAASMPKNARCHFEYGKILRSTGNNQKARRELELARSIDPDFASNLYALSRLYHALGERDLEANTMRDFLAARQKANLER